MSNIKHIKPKELKCPKCGASAQVHEAQEGRWQTTAVVSCKNKDCARHIENQRARRHWYLQHAPLGFRGGLKAWELW